jgi:hypothetical protein
MRRSDHRARGNLAALAATLVLLTMIGPAAAASPQPITIVSHMTFNDPGPNTGDFSVTGAGGLMCASGSVVDTNYVFGGGQSNRRLQIQVLKDFICADGSGTIHVKIQVHIDFAVGETFTWIVRGGTGAYGHLSGSGQGSTVPNADPNSGNTNTYVGFIVG